jgi:hypothetical protein
LSSDVAWNYAAPASRWSALSTFSAGLTPTDEWPVAGPLTVEANRLIVQAVRRRAPATPTALNGDARFGRRAARRAKDQGGRDGYE